MEGFYMYLKRVSIVAGAAAALLTGCSSTSSDDVAKSEFKEYPTQVTLAGEDNMRDEGGFTGTGGKRVLYRKLFRSGELSKLTADDTNTIKNLGIQQVIDLRTQSEITEKPDVLPSTVTSYKIPLLADFGGSAGMSSLIGSILKDSTAADKFMCSTYVVDSLKVANWKKIFDLLETGKSTLWHCTAGKDRAGMTSVLVLSALGVDSASAVKDFLASNTYLDASIQKDIANYNTQLAAYGSNVGEKLKPVLVVKQSYIDTFYSSIKTQYGSMEKFLDTLGVDRAALRNNYLEK